MKILLSFILFAFTSISGFGQFETCNSGTTKNLYDIYFIDSNIGIAVGDSGTIVRSVDSGLNWNTVLSVDTTFFKKVAFFDDQNGLAIGRDIYRTVDGGQNWYLIDLPNSFYVDIAVLNATDCLISGYPNRLVKSTDKGESWQLLYSDTSSMFFGFLSFINENQGFSSVDGGGGGFPVIAETLDGGLNWEVLESSQNGPVVLEAYEFISPEVGFFGGWYTSHLMKTTNTGQDWTSVATDTSGQAFYPEILDFHIRADQPNAYYASCWFGQMYKSVDGGDTWFQLNTGVPSDVSIYGVYFIDEEAGWAVGDNGLIIRTTTGGEVVNVSNISSDIAVQVYPNPATRTFRIEYPDGVVVTGLTLIDTNGKILKSFNELISEMDVTGLPAGIYFLKIETNKGSGFKKVVVE